MGTPPPDEAPARKPIFTRFARALVSADSYGLVLLLLVVSYVAAAMWTSSLAASVVLFIEIGTVWLALRTSQAHRRVRQIATGFMVVAAVVGVLNIFGEDEPSVAVFVVATLLYLLAPFSIIRHLASRHTIDQETVIGAICAYLLFGFSFAFLYRVLGEFGSTPFFGVDAGPITMGQTLFFSFTTLTTTGYGNLVPAGNPGQSLAVTEMILGQLFLITAMGKIVTEWRPRRWGPGQTQAPESTD